MDVKEAVKKAKAYVADLLEDEKPINLGLEEMQHDEISGTWDITVGFSRAWNVTGTGFAMGLTSPASRTYKIVKLRDSDGTVISFKNREV